MPARMRNDTNEPVRLAAALAKRPRPVDEVLDRAGVTTFGCRICRVRAETVEQPS
jgi:hypothetical protein